MRPVRHRLWRHFEDPKWTDLALMLGPNLRWVEEDYEDLQHAYPEVFLGYRVLLATPNTNFDGYRIMKLVIVGTEDWSIKLSRATQRAARMVNSAGGKIETWYVHRGRGIHRIA